VTPAPATRLYPRLSTHVNCPYHDVERCARAQAVPETAGALAALDCGYPARVCSVCRTANRTYARHCRHCRGPLGEAARAPSAAPVLKGLWAAPRGEDPVAYTVSLPSGTASVGALTAGWGFLFAGTAGGSILAFSALRPGAVLARITVPGAVLALECVSRPGAEWPLAPALLATTDEGVFIVPLVPTPGVEALWPRSGTRWTAGAAVPLRTGALAFRRHAKGVEALWAPWDGGAPEPAAASDPFGGPVGRPLRLDPFRAFFFGAEAAHVFHAANGSPAHVRAGRLPLVPEPTFAPSYLGVTDEVFYVYRRGNEYGVARAAAGDLSTLRCTQPRYASAQVVAIDARAVCVASEGDLEILAPVSGDRLWSLRDNQHLDNLNVSEFQPVISAGHLLMLGRMGGSTDSLYLLPLSNEALREGPRRIGAAGRPQLPPLAVPGGVVCVTREPPHPEPVLRVIHPPRQPPA
jgi:hypothetical protein